MRVRSAPHGVDEFNVFTLKFASAYIGSSLNPKGGDVTQTIGGTWMKVAEVARKTGDSEPQIRLLIREGVLRAVRNNPHKARSMFRVDTASVEAYIAVRDATPVVPEPVAA